MMKVYLLAGVAALMCVGTALAGTVHVASGDVEGVTKDGVESFKGIPYAAPPVGDLRWRAPQAARPWAGVLKADEYGHDCMQKPLSWDTNFMAKAPSEDCLMLNVWRPVGSEGKKLPVMVWIYGGAFLNGGSSLAIYDGRHFAEDGVVFVSMNYRLGRFGFFGHPALTAADADQGRLGNYAFMDQIAALTWVKSNISAFGGDPAQVTIFGESADGGSVLALLTSPEAKGLYSRAIVQSGGGRGPLMGTRYLREDMPDKPSSETLGINFARKYGISDTDSKALDALRALSSDQVLGDLNGDNSWQQTDTYGGPMTDGKVVTQSPGEAFIKGQSPKVPVMIGVTSADIGFFNAKSKAEAFASFGSLSAQAKAAYDPDGTRDLKTINIQIGRDRVMAEPARFVAKTLAGQGLPVYEYRFSYVANSKEAEWTQGVPHFEEIIYAFNTLDVTYGDHLTERDRQMARTTHAYWVKFAKGDMSGWPPYDPVRDEIMDFQRDGTAKIVPDPAKAQLDVVEASAGL